MKCNRKDNTTLQDLARFDANIARWERQGRRESDREVAAQYAEDVEALRIARKLIAECQLEAAAHLINNLDTIIRDQVPAQLFNQVCKSADLK